jgi:hypothetical protein
MISLLKLDSNTIKVRKKEVLEEQNGQGEEIEVLDPYSMFIFAMNSRTTQKKYTGRLTRFLDFTGLRQGTTPERCKVFVNRANTDRSGW